MKTTRDDMSNEVDPVTDPLDSVLVELEQFGRANDASTTERPRRMLNITRDTGEFLAVLVRATLARRVLEIGTSNGYSTLWLASAARTIGGSVTKVHLRLGQAARLRRRCRPWGGSSCARPTPRSAFRPPKNARPTTAA
jgi:predicted O-methyltransferase YrrM